MTYAEAATTETTATVAEQDAPVAPEKATSKKGTTQKKGAPKGQKSAMGGKAKPAAKEAKPGKKASKPARAKEASTPRPESKGAKNLEMIPKGASLAEIMRSHGLGPQRPRFSSTAAKKPGLKMGSAKTETGDSRVEFKK